MRRLPSAHIRSAVTSRPCQATPVKSRSLAKASKITQTGAGVNMTGRTLTVAATMGWQWTRCEREINERLTSTKGLLGISHLPCCKVIGSSKPPLHQQQIILHLEFGAFTGDLGHAFCQPERKIKQVILGNLVATDHQQASRVALQKPSPFHHLPGRACQATANFKP